MKRNKDISAFSAEHINYLRGLRRRERAIFFCRIGILAIVLGIWEALASSGAVNAFITSSPSRIVATVISLSADGSLWRHVGITLGETLLGFALSTVLGYALALLLWWNEFVRRLLEPYIVVLNALPKIALGPLIIIWFGTGTKAIIFMTFIVCIIIATMNMLSGFMATDKHKYLLLQSMGADKFTVLIKLVVPSSLPDFINMLKINVGMAWIGSVMGEYIVSKAGIGYLIVYGGQVFKLDLVMAAVALLCVMAGGMYAVVAVVEKNIIKGRGYK